jgi:prepilin-type N-terminal cleavage/methylation domain-containing protein
MESAHGQDGFTLAEVLVTLAVFGLMTSAAIGITSTLRIVENRSNADNQIVESVTAAKTVFRSVVAEAEIEPEPTADTSPPGESDRLTFRARGPESLASAGPRPIELRVERDRAGETLEFGWTDPQTNIRRSEAVLVGAKAISFRYFGTSPSGERGWLDVWDDRTTLPEAVMLRLELNDAGAPFEIVVRTPEPPETQCTRTSTCLSRTDDSQ